MSTATAAGGTLVLIPFLGQIGVGPLLVDYKLWIGWFQVILAIFVISFFIAFVMTITIKYNNDNNAKGESSSSLTVTTTDKTLPYGVATAVLILISNIFWIVSMVLTWKIIARKNLYHA